jgi:hypothetical protein
MSSAGAFALDGADVQATKRRVPAFRLRGAVGLAYAAATKHT